MHGFLCVQPLWVPLFSAAVAAALSFLGGGGTRVDGTPGAVRGVCDALPPVLKSQKGRALLLSAIPALRDTHVHTHTHTPHSCTSRLFNAPL